jgi:hypothetical protein
MNPLSKNKAWSYVGRFITSWAMIENTVNQIFLSLIGGGPNQQLSTTVGFMLTYTLDLRKKLHLVRVIL